MTILLTLLLAQHLGCASLGGRTGGRTVEPDNAAAEQEMYLLYPELMRLQERLDTASAYYYMGDLESTVELCEDLIGNIRAMQERALEPAVCDRLDLLENMTLCLQQSTEDEVLEEDWQNHINAALDSIGRYHVVEEEIEIDYNWRTKHWLNYFTGQGKRHFRRWLARADQYRNIIEPILVEQNIPRDLLFLAVIESGLNLSARSNAKAVGPWQFMAGTARLFNLRINWWIDERKDIIASTYAAAHYLRHLYDLFGSWPLALAAYNCGEYRVAHAVSRQKTDDYWRLRLPSQTKWFVPKYMAALAISRDPAGHGFPRQSVEPADFDIISIDRSTDLRLIAKGCGCTVTTIKNLNPALKRWATPPGMVIELKVPRGSGRKCLAAIAEIPESERVSWLRHTVRSGETLSSIARQYEVAVSELKRLNNIRNANRIRAGHALLIPVKDADVPAAESNTPDYRTAPSLPDKITMKQYQPPAGKKKLVYTVKARDTLSEIAERYGVGLSRLRQWNDLRYTSIIHPGDRLVIYVSPDAAIADDVSGEPDSGGKKRIIHIVKRGETLSHISRMYKARIADILAWNTGIKKNLLYPGDRITIWLETN